MKNLLLLVGLLVSCVSYSQSLYDLNTVQSIYITFSESNWDALLDAQKTGAGDYTMAQSVEINGVMYDSVGVKYKGNSSYKANQVKNPFHIELDTYKDHDYEGYTDIKLSNVIFDPSFVREAVAYKILRNYMDAPLANFARVYVNGDLIGLYTNVESISKKFVNKRFGSKSNPFFSCSPPDGASPQSSDFPNLAYLGNNASSYESAYEMKSDSGWNELIQLTNTLSNDIGNIESILDVDRALWMLAFDNILVNIDSYIGQFKQNYYLYQDDNGRFNSIVWDLNMSFGVFDMTGSGNLNGTTRKMELSPTLHETDAAWPLVRELLGVPTYKKMYLAHFKTMLTEAIMSGDYLTDAQTMQALINPDVLLDNNKFSYQSNIASNITTDISVDRNNAPGLQKLMDGRADYLSNLAEFTNTQPTITNVVAPATSPQVGDDITITAMVTDANTDAVFLNYRYEPRGVFQKVLMYDDGNHNDGAAGDNVYGSDVTVNSSLLEYYVYAENDNIGAFSPARAQHEFYTLTASFPTIAPGDLVINEIMASNAETVTDPSGKYEDWLELYNNSDVTLSLDNLYASDDTTDLLQWEFPAGTTIEPNGYLIIWADKDEDEDGLHADFKFSADGESCVLSYANGDIVDSVSFGAQTTDMSLSRIPNGTGNFVIKEPTFNENNETIISIDDINASYASLQYFPNPTSGIINFKTDEQVIESIEVINLQGQVLQANTYAKQSNVIVDLSTLPDGMYFLNINREMRVSIVKN